MNDIETLLGYAEKFLDRARSPSFTIAEFRGYLRNLEEDTSTLSDAPVAERISAAVRAVKSDDYAFANFSNMKDKYLLRPVEKLVGVIRDEIPKA
jgi:hypothetical protein